MKRIISKIFRKGKKISLSATARVELARNKVNEAFIMFQQAQDAIDESNVELNKAVSLAEQNEWSYVEKANAERKVKEKAIEELHLNNKLSQQLQPFLQ